MEIKNQKIALLVDGDNAQAKIMDLILEEASKYGKVTIRRVYGDWTTQHMNHWKSILNEMAFNPMQKFSYTTGKNSKLSLMHNHHLFYQKEIKFTCVCVHPF